MSDNSDDDDDYQVGPGKPPKHSRFKPGQSGNPGGKKKGTPNVRTAVENTLAITISTKDGPDKTALEAVLVATLSKACKGDLRAAKFFIKLAREFETDAQVTSEPEDDTSDSEIMRRYLKRQSEDDPDE